MLSISNLRALVAVADSGGGIRAAAKRIQRTPSAVSMALKQLETSLEAPLFEGERKTHPTKLGLLVIESARDLLKHYDNMSLSIIGYAKNEISRCTIASVSSLAGSILPDVIQRIKARSKNFEVMIRELHSTKMLDAVAEGVVDVGIGRISTDRSDIIIEPLFKDGYSVVCTSDHHLSTKHAGVSWEEIRNEVIITNETYDYELSEKLGETGKASQFHVSSASSAFAMVRAEVGITIMPSLAKQIAPQNLIFLPIEDQDIMRTIGMFTRRGRTTTPATNLLLDTIRQMVLDSAEILNIRPL